ncbi:MAG: hypothetical protein V1735_03910 [Nanoarchaeota archaeon]
MTQYLDSRNTAKLITESIKQLRKGELSSVKPGTIIKEGNLPGKWRVQVQDYHSLAQAFLDTPFLIVEVVERGVFRPSRTQDRVEYGIREGTQHLPGLSKT